MVCVVTVEAAVEGLRKSESGRVRPVEVVAMVVPVAVELLRPEGDEEAEEVDESTPIDEKERRKVSRKGISSNYAYFVELKTDESRFR